MTKDQIEGILNRVHTWPPSRQEDAARMLLAMEAQETAPYVLSDEERADLEAALVEIADGDIATEAEVASLFSQRRR